MIVVVLRGLEMAVKSRFTHRWWVKISEVVYQYLAFGYLVTIIVGYWFGETFLIGFLQPWEIVAYLGLGYAALYFWASRPLLVSRDSWISRLVSEKSINIHIVVLLVGIFTFTHLYTMYLPTSAVFHSIWPMLTYPLMLLSSNRSKVGQTPWPLLVALSGFSVVVIIEIRRLGWLASIQAESWVLVFALLIQYLSRRNIMTEERTYVLNEVSNMLMRMPLSAGYYQTVVNLIGTQLEFPTVSLLTLDLDNPETLRVRAGFGKPENVWKHLSIPMKSSIAGIAATSRRSQRWDDVSKCTYYFRTEGYLDTRSELCAPIYSGEELFGVLDAQSNELGTFIAEDEKTLGLLADAVGIALAQENAIRHIERTVNLASDELSELETEEQIFRSLATFISRELNADLISCHSLNIGTFWPKDPPYLWPEEDDPLHKIGYIDRDKILNSRRFIEDTVIRMLVLWQAYFQPSARDDHLINSSLWRTPNDQRRSFVETENVNSMAFIPLGTEDNREGCIFINFHKRHEFSKNEVSTLKALAQATALQLFRVKRREWLYEGFGQPGFSIHELLQEHRSRLLERIRDIREHPRDDEYQKRCLHDMEIEITEASKRFLLAASGQHPYYESDSLQYGLSSLSRSLAYASKSKINYSVDVAPSLEMLSGEVKLVLYRLANEFMRNVARYTNDATWCKVRIYQVKSTLNFEVSHNGEGFDPEKVRPGRFGIFHMIDLVREYLNATPLWLPEAPVLKTGLRITFPTLPRLEELYYEHH